MAEAINTLAVLGAMMAVCDLLLPENAQKRGVFFVGALLTAGAVLRFCAAMLRWLEIP